MTNTMELRDMVSEVEKNLRTEGIEKILIRREDGKEIARGAFTWLDKMDGGRMAQIGKVVYRMMDEKRNIYKLVNIEEGKI